MKLKKEFITQMIGDTQMMIAVGKEDFHGIVKSNETAAFIIDHLKKETTEDKIVQALLDEYDVEETRAREDVKKLIEKLRGIGAIVD